MNKLIAVVIGIAIVVGFFAFMNTEGGLYPVEEAGEEANTVFALTDEAGDYEEMNLDISEIKLYKEEESTPIVIPVNQEFDLTELQDKVVALAEENVSEEQYRKITMELNQVQVRERNQEQLRDLSMSREEFTIAEDAYLEEGNNSVKIDIPVDKAVKNESFSPNVVTHVKGGVNVETPSGREIKIRPGESVSITGGHSNAEVNVEVGEQGQQQIQTQVSEQAQERINQMEQERAEAQGSEPEGSDAGGFNPMG